MANILVVYEIRDKQIKKVSLEATSAANKLAGETGGLVSVLLMGSGIESLAPVAGQFGAQKVYLIDHPSLAKFSPDVSAKLIAGMVKDAGVSHIFMGASAMGKDVMPRVAYHLGSPMAQDVTVIQQQGGNFVYTRPVIAGKIQAQIILNGTYQIATLRPNVFPAVEKPVTPEVSKLNPDIPEARVVVDQILATGGGKQDVTEAEIIVSGGRGLQGPENWHLIEKLASVLGAATGASRAVVDAGWRDHGEQVGQTGKTVSPTLYVACGISGAIQHQAGMTSSKYIVAINKDPEAPIFKLADYGIVGDVFEVLPRLAEELEKVRN